MIERDEGNQTVSMTGEEFMRLFEYIDHAAWRCSHPDRYPDCCCGLDNLCDDLGVERVPRPSQRA